MVLSISWMLFWSVYFPIVHITNLQAIYTQALFLIWERNRHIDGIPGSRLAGMAVLKTLNSWHSLAHSAAIAEWLFILILLLEKCRQFGAQVVPSEIRFQLKWRIFCDSWLVQFFSSAAPEILNFEPLSCFSDMWWVHCHCHVTAIWDTHDNPWYGSIVTYSPPHLLVYSPSLPPPPPPSLTSLFTIAFCFHYNFTPPLPSVWTVVCCKNILLHVCQTWKP